MIAKELVSCDPHAALNIIGHFSCSIGHTRQDRYAQANKGGRQNDPIDCYSTGIIPSKADPTITNTKQKLSPLTSGLIVVGTFVRRMPA